MVVYVLDSEGRQLEATERFGKVRRLLKNKQAKVVNQSPFTIQLLYEIENKGDNLMNNIYEICDNYYVTLEALKSEDDAIKESDECKKLYEIANKYKDEIIKFVSSDSELYIKNIEKLEKFSPALARYDLHHFIDEYGKYPYFSLDIPMMYDSLDIRNSFSSKANKTNEIINSLKITHLFKDDTEEFITLLNNIIAKEEKIFNKYCEFINNFEPIILFVTDSDRIPKVTNYKSMIISSEDYNNILYKHEKDMSYKVQGKYEHIKISRHNYNIFADIFVDARCYVKIPELLNLDTYMGFETYLVANDTTYDFLYKHTYKGTYLTEESLNKAKIFEECQTWTMDDMYKYFETHTSDICVFRQEYIRDALEYGEYTNRKDMYKATYVYHMINIVCNDKNYLNSNEIKKDLVEYFSSNNQDKTYTFDMRYNDFSINNVRLKNYIVEYSHNKDNIIINTYEPYWPLYEQSSVKNLYQLDCQLVIDNTYYVYKDVFGNLNIVPISIYVETETVMKSEKLYKKYSLEYNTHNSNMYLLDLYKTTYKTYEIPFASGMITKFKEYTKKIQAVKDILKANNVISIEDLPVSIRNRINCIPTVIHINQDFYDHINEKYLTAKHFDTLSKTIEDPNELLKEIDIIKNEGSLANIFIYFME